MDRDSGMSMQWVNHASFLLEGGSCGLLVDPWLVGTAFDDGWAQYSPSAFGPELFASTTHIWFSHEHPDHFSPASLRQIPEADRGRITVLYQPTEDSKVLGFCRAQGFAAVELPSCEWFDLDASMSVRVVPWSSGDSVLAVRTPNAVVLDVNDAVVSDAVSMRLLLSRADVDRIDVLLTQFSYANWEGNPDAVERRRTAAASKLDALAVQVDVARPRFVMPFASFVWFCHEENDYLNDEVNTVADAVAAIEADGVADPVVLYPGERWRIGEPHDSSDAIERYGADLERTLDESPRLTSQRIPLEELQAAAVSFLESLRATNGDRTFDVLARTHVLGTAHIWLSDHQLGVELSPTGLSVAPSLRHDECDIELGSAALAFCFRFLYGGGTLRVNGRFREPPHGRPARFRRYMQLANLNNQGIGATAAVPDLVRKLARTARERLVRLRHRTA